MSGDYTRFTYNPQKHYSRVLMQQGRVQLDADWNEAIELIQQRLQKQTIDTFGRVAVSRFSTPNAFRVSVAGSNLALTPGRIYVDGLVAEILPGQSLTYANQPFYPAPPALSTLTGNALVYLDVWEREVTYIEDPELLEPALGGPDTTTRIQTVWQVKVRSLETATATCTPDFATLFSASAGRLSSRAVNAPATTDPCILAPSGGFRGLENQLYRVEIHTAGGINTAKFKWSRDNASIVARVQQISSVGGASQLTVSRIGRDRVLRFKVNDWVEITDDWREWMGEAGEMARVVSLNEAAQTIQLDRPIPTTGGRIFGANTTELQSRHTRIRRWDQQANTDSNGLCMVRSSWAALEDGVEVDFSVVGTGRFEIGDYWVFAARTADASVESLTNAPPRGIEHHYAALATLTGLPTFTLQSDCRIIWFREGGQGGGCCTVVVQPGENIQAAIDSLPLPGGGCVCLKPGDHIITEPIRISQSNITLQGETLGARVVRDNGVSLLAIASTTDLSIENIIIENIHFETTGEVAGEFLQKVGPEDLFDNGLISVVQGRDVFIRQCELVAISKVSQGVTIPIQSIGILIFKSQQISVYTNQVQFTSVGIWSEDSTDVMITQNLITGQSVPFGQAALPISLVGVLVDYQFAAELVVDERRGIRETCIIEQNQIEDVWIGIYLGIKAIESMIARNTILRPRLRGLESLVGTLLQSLSPFLLEAEPFIYGIVSLARSCTIASNQITLNYGAYGGIRVLGELTHIELNQITGNALPIKFFSGTATLDRLSSSNATQSNDLLPMGIVLASSSNRQLSDVRPGYSTVRSNTLKGAFLIGIWVVEVEQAQVLENRIEAGSDTILLFGINVLLAQNTCISKNQIYDVRNAAICLVKTIRTQIVENQLKTGIWGILANNDRSLEVTQTIIEDMKYAGIGGGNLQEFTIIRQTQIISCGYEPLYDQPVYSEIGAGIFIFNDPANPNISDSLGSLQVESCEILNTGISLDGKVLNKQINYGIAAGALRSCHILSTRVVYSDRYLKSGIPLDITQESRALLLSGSPVNGVDGRVEGAEGSALISENLFSGIGFSRLVEVKRLTKDEIDLFKSDLQFEKVTFTNNICEHLVSEKQADNPATVSLWASYSIVTGNHIKSDLKGYPSINLNRADEKDRHVIFMGNITSGPWINLGNHIPLPEQSFNIQLS